MPGESLAACFAPWGNVEFAGGDLYYASRDSKRNHVLSEESARREDRLRCILGIHKEHLQASRRELHLQPPPLQALCVRRCVSYLEMASWRGGELRKWHSQTPCHSRRCGTPIAARKRAKDFVDTRPKTRNRIRTRTTDCKPRGTAQHSLRCRKRGGCPCRPGWNRNSHAGAGTRGVR